MPTQPVLPYLSPTRSLPSLFGIMIRYTTCIAGQHEAEAS